VVQSISEIGELSINLPSFSLPRHISTAVRYMQCVLTCDNAAIFQANYNLPKFMPPKFPTLPKIIIHTVSSTEGLTVAICDLICGKLA